MNCVKRWSLVQPGTSLRQECLLSYGNHFFTGIPDNATFKMGKEDNEKLGFVDVSICLGLHSWVWAGGVNGVFELFISEMSGYERGNNVTASVFGSGLGLMECYFS